MTKEKYWNEVLFPDGIRFPGNNAGIIVPSGLTDQRPSVPDNGTIRYNTQTNALEAYVDLQWRRLLTTNAVNSSTVNNKLGIHVSSTDVAATIGIDILGQAVLASPGSKDALLVYDDATNTNKKLELRYFFESFVSSRDEKNAPVIGDMFLLYDSATGINKKLSYKHFTDSFISISEGTIVVNDVDTFKALDFTLPKYANAKSLLILDEARGGLFDLVNSGVDDDGLTFSSIDTLRYAVRRYSNSVHVDWFGAKGDGVTDDRIAIQRAFDAAGAGATIEFGKNKTYFVKANTTRLEPHWNRIPRIQFTGQTGTVTVGATVTGANSGDTATLVGIDSTDGYYGLRNISGPFLNGEPLNFSSGGSATAASAVVGNPSSLGPGEFYSTHCGIELKHSYQTIRGNGCILRLGSNFDIKGLPFMFANRKDNPLTGLKFYDINIDLNITPNSGGAQPRGFMLVKVTDSYVDESVKIYSSSAKGGYCFDMFACERWVMKPYMFNISGGIFCDFCDSMVIAPTARIFNEAVDLDKSNSNITVSGKFMDGGVSSEILDSNATTHLVVTNFRAENCGLLFWFNGKPIIAANFEDHINGINYAFRQGSAFTVDDTVTAYNCAYNTVNGTRAIMSIGNNWAGNPHPGQGPVRDIVIKGHYSKCGFINISEGDNILIDCQMEDIMSPTVPSTTGAVVATTEDDFVTYPDAATDSILNITFGANFSVNTCNRSAIDVSWANEVTILGAKIRNPATHGNTTDRAIYIRGVEKRNTKAYITNYDIDCNSACDGIGLHAADYSTADIKFGTGKIRNTINYPIRLAATSDQLIGRVSGKMWSQYMGPFDDAGLPLTNIPILTPVNGSGICILEVHWTDSNGVAADGTNYVSLLVRRHDSTGTFEGNLLSMNTSATALPLRVPVNLGTPLLTYQNIDVGNLFFQIGKTGTAPTLRGTLTVHYIEY